ncbi:Short chain dehydrogenase citE [Apiospora arundinis]|uniref:Short chain dehydrogenase citE n=1 Tax=Apiospora arundinis TaxID=335852 RepID=A0ABR2JJB3_9PEZI
MTKTLSIERSLRSLAVARVHVLPADITNEVAVNGPFAKATADFGPLDVVVNNAAFLPAVSALKDATLSDWWRGFEVNILGTAIVTQAFLKTKPAGRKGVAININTSVAHYGVFPTYSLYTSSKMAALRMTECLPAEHPDDVRFFSLQPGGVDTDMYAKLHMPDHYPMTDIDLRSDTSVWLASDEANFLAGRFM